MGKLIGQGKDPRFPKGVDFDVPDDEVAGYEKAGLGKPVDPSTREGIEQIHPASKIIKEDPMIDAEADGRAEESGGNADQVASRVESTAPKHDTSKPRAARSSSDTKEAHGSESKATSGK